jgi:cysteine sulfinate desulfinase/cysteine desulfurase-like protein/rhodanese-related sulfurtransferase
MSTTIYLDSNATTPVHPGGAAAALRVMQVQFGNPSSTHSHGLVAKDVLEESRADAAVVIGAGDGHVIFNSGATEGIQTAALSVLCDIRDRLRRCELTGHVLVYGATEHKAVPQSLAHWNTILGLQLELRALPVNDDGQHDLATLSEWLPDVAMLCTMAANNETGVVSDLAAIEQLLKSADTALGRRIPWLVDCVQALGKLPLNLSQTRVDYAPFSGHKLYAPKGIGMLYVRRGAAYTALMAGGGQEDGMRSGTENMSGIAAFGAVLKELLGGNTFVGHRTLEAHQDALRRSLLRAFPGVVFNAPLSKCLPTTLNFSVPGISSKTLLDVFDAAGLSVSAGSACSAAKSLPSYVLDAMGMPPWRTTSAVRMSFGPAVSGAEITAACEAIARCGDAILQPSLPPAAPALSSPPVGLPASITEPVEALRWGEMGAFLKAHPTAILVDVREVQEAEVSGGVQCPEWRVLNMPLSQLPRFAIDGLLTDASPVVFVCRSGNRSLKAAQWLQAQGHPAVRHVHGGLALKPLLPVKSIHEHTAPCRWRNTLCEHQTVSPGVDRVEA